MGKKMGGKLHRRGAAKLNKRSASRKTSARRKPQAPATDTPPDR